MSVLFAESSVSRTTGEPRVQLSHDGRQFAQVSPDEARAWALNVLEAAEAAEQDAFLVAFHRDRFDLIADSMAIIRAYRVWRDERRVAWKMGEEAE